jgi:hypothetical protein
MRRVILLIGGSLNQTSMMHRIAQALPDHDCHFTPYYADAVLRQAAERGLLDRTILGRPARQRTLNYLAEHGLSVDERGEARRYDLVVTGSDLIVPRNVRGLPLVLVQEGMTDPEDLRYRLVRTLHLPRYLANTSMTGLSHAYRRFCVASEGYRQLFIAKGVPADRIAVTSLPGFDNVGAYRSNSFPYRNYVLAATSCLRETLKPENRKAFILRARRIAAGRPLLFKLHPNERIERARREVARFAPEALVFADGNTNHMIANCDALVTRYSTVALVAAALRKEVHSDIIADVCREHLC